MKTYTQADFDTFEVDKFGRKICPAGDYTAIKDFVEYCVFGAYCLFGEHSRFIEHCRFGDGCYFGDGCSFGAYCYFGTGGDFGKECRFGELCGFGEGGNFGEGCSFGEWCTFGECCNFGERCSYENDTVKNGRYVAVDRIGNTNQKSIFTEMKTAICLSAPGVGLRIWRHLRVGLKKYTWWEQSTRRYIWRRVIWQN